MKGNVLLLRPSGKKTDSRLFAMEQLGLSYIAAVARAQGLAVDIVDGFLDPIRYECVLNTLDQGDYHVIGYPIYQESVNRVAKDVTRMRQRGVKTHVTVGNHLATLSAELILQNYPQFDSVIRGEGEYTLTELAKCLDRSSDPLAVLGISYRNGTQIIHNPPRANTEILDELPFPARDTLPLVLQAGNAPLLYSSRGCNCRCEFCSVHKFFRASPQGAWRARSPKNVVDEMELLANQFGVSEFAFADEQFMGHGSAGVQRALGIADELIKRDLNFKWYIETRSSDVKIEIFARLHQAGLRAVFMGVESGYDPALKALRKGLSVSHHIHAIDVLKKLNIISSVGFIMFRPETTPEELDYNLNFLEEIGCAEITALLTKLRVYPGTDLEKSLKDAERLVGTFPKYDWEFQDRRVSDCFRIIMESADTISVAYNEFADFRRKGQLSFDECLALQRVMNSGPISIVRNLIREVCMQRGASEELAQRYRQQFKETCEDFLRLLRFTEIIAQNRQIDDGMRLLNPMSLC